MAGSRVDIKREWEWEKMVHFSVRSFLGRQQVCFGEEEEEDEDDDVKTSASPTYACYSYILLIIHGVFQLVV